MVEAKKETLPEEESVVSGRGGESIKLRGWRRVRAVQGAQGVLWNGLVEAQVKEAMREDISHVVTEVTNKVSDLN